MIYEVHEVIEEVIKVLRGFLRGYYFTTEVIGVPRYIYMEPNILF